MRDRSAGRVRKDQFHPSREVRFEDHSRNSLKYSECHIVLLKCIVLKLTMYE